jgi:hypothetical protein
LVSQDCSADLRSWHLLPEKISTWREGRSWF